MCTGYEVDFIAISKEEAKKDADAICFRWKKDDGTIGIAIYDAGFQAHGEAMVRHINKHYFDDPCGKKNRDKKKIDYVFVSHPHEDHAGGIPEIIRNFTIGCIYMNRPWIYSKELLELSRNDGRITENSLTNELRQDFPCIAEIEKVAIQYCVPIKAAFAGMSMDELIILAPTKDYYFKNLLKSEKTQRLQAEKEYALFEKEEKMVPELWDEETLGDDHAEFDAENETSIVLYGFKGIEGMLLTGDSGIGALSIAYSVANSIGISIKDDAGFVEIPHHGGRHNVTTSIMNLLFGYPIDRNDNATKTAYVSVADGSDHPRRVVVNAFLRRGFEVYKTRNCIRWHHRGDMPQRYDFSASKDNLAFNRFVEEW